VFSILIFLFFKSAPLFTCVSHVEEASTRARLLFPFFQSPAEDLLSPPLPSSSDRLEHGLFPFPLARGRYSGFREQGCRPPGCPSPFFSLIQRVEFFSSFFPFSPRLSEIGKPLSFLDLGLFNSKWSSGESFFFLAAPGGRLDHLFPFSRIELVGDTALFFSLFFSPQSSLR